MRSALLLAAALAVCAVPASAGIAPLIKGLPPVQVVGMPPPVIVVHKLPEGEPHNSPSDDEDCDWLDPPYPLPPECEPDEQSDRTP